MTDEEIKDMLSANYSITLSGGHVAYILKLLAMEQFNLNEDVEADVADIMAHAMAAANDIVGNSLLHEAYRVCGAAFLAFAMDVDEKSVDKFMQSKTPEEVERNGEEIARKHAVSRNKSLN